MGQQLATLLCLSHENVSTPSYYFLSGGLLKNRNHWFSNFNTSVHKAQAQIRTHANARIRTGAGAHTHAHNKHTHARAEKRVHIVKTPLSSNAPHLQFHQLHVETSNAKHKPMHDHAYVYKHTHMHTRKTCSLRWLRACCGLTYVNM